MTDSENRCPDCGLLLYDRVLTRVEKANLDSGDVQVQVTTTTTDHDDYRCLAMRLDREWRDQIIRWREEDLLLNAERHKEIVYQLTQLYAIGGCSHE